MVRPKIESQKYSGESEFHGQLRQQRSEKVQRDAGEQTAAEGGEAGHGQRLARLPLQGELVALNGGGGRAGVPGVWIRMAEMEPPKIAPQ